MKEFEKAILAVLRQIKRGERPTQGLALEEAIRRRLVDESISASPISRFAKRPRPTYTLTVKGEEYLAQQGP